MAKVKTPVIVAIAVIITAIVVFGAAYYIFVLTKPPAKPQLRIGTSADYPPFEFIKEVNGRYAFAGFDVDLMNWICERIGYEPVWYDMPFESLIPALQAGKIDVIIAAMTITAEREKIVDFSIPYYNADQGILTLYERRAEFKSVDDINKTTVIVGVQTGTTGEAWAKEYLIADIKGYERVYDMLQALKAKHLDVVIIDSPVAHYYNNTDPELWLAFTVETGERYGIAVAEGNTELLNKINNALREAFESGYYDQLVGKWFGGTELPDPLVTNNAVGIIFPILMVPLIIVKRKE